MIIFHRPPYSSAAQSGACSSTTKTTKTRRGMPNQHNVAAKPTARRRRQRKRERKCTARLPDGVELPENGAHRIGRRATQSAIMLHLRLHAVRLHQLRQIRPHPKIVLAGLPA